MPRLGEPPAVVRASSMSTAVSSAVASSTPPAASERQAGATWSWKSAMHCKPFGCISCRGNRWFNRDKLHYLELAATLAIFAWQGQSSYCSCRRDYAAIDPYSDASLQQVNGENQQPLCWYALYQDPFHPS